MHQKFRTADIICMATPVFNADFSRFFLLVSVPAADILLNIQLPFTFRIFDLQLVKLIKDDVLLIHGCLCLGRYVAPEVYKNEEYDTKVDVFSFALILQEVSLSPSLPPSLPLSVSRTRVRTCLCSHFSWTGYM